MGLLYNKAYNVALSALSEKRAAGIAETVHSDIKWLFERLTEPAIYAWLAGQAVPIATMGAAGAAAGYALNRLSRRADPAVADSNTRDEIKRVERLKRIQYYNNLSKQIDAVDPNK